MSRCAFYRPYMDALKQLCGTLYTLEGCSAGGLLHIMLDDNNVDDESILYCLNECILHPEEPESTLGIIICNEYLKMPMTERLVFDWYWNGSILDCCGDCENCGFLEDFLRIEED